MKIFSGMFPLPLLPWGCFLNAYNWDWQGTYLEMPHPSSGARTLLELRGSLGDIHTSMRPLAIRY